LPRFTIWFETRMGYRGATNMSLKPTNITDTDIINQGENSQEIEADVNVALAEFSETAADESPLVENTDNSISQLSNREDIGKTKDLNWFGAMMTAVINEKLAPSRNNLLAGATTLQDGVQSGTNRPDLEQRAQKIFERFQNDGPLGLNPQTPYGDIAAQLAGLSSADTKQLLAIYREKYSAQRRGRDLLSDISLEIPELQDRLRAFRILAPERVIDQPQAKSGFGNQAGIIADPVYDEIVSGVTVKYTFDKGATIAPLNDPGPFVRYLIQGEGGRVAQTGYSFDGYYEKPGVYQVTFEVINRNQPPTYYTLKQVVRDPAEKARESLLRQMGTTIDPDLYMEWVNIQIQDTEQQIAALRAQPGTTAIGKQISFLEDRLEQLRETRSEVPALLNNGSISRPIPLQAVLIPTENGQSVPLQLYAKPLANNRWAIVDITNSTDGRIYEGKAGTTPEESIKNAWQEFISANNLPKGQIAAIPPRIPPNYQSPGGVPKSLNFPSTELWNDRSNGQSGFQKWASGLGWGSLALGVLGIGALFVPGAQPAAPWLLGAAGAAGVASGGLNIYDRVNYGNFQLWSRDTALDLVGIVGGLASIGGSAALLKAGSSALSVTANGGNFTLRNLGRFTSITQGIDQGANIAGGVIIATAYLQQIERIKNTPGLSEAEQEKQIQQVVNQAMIFGGIIVTGTGLSRFKPLVGDELEQLLSNSKLRPDLEQLVRESPGLQRVLLEQGQNGPKTLTELHDDYLKGGKGGDLKVGSFLEYVSARKYRTSTEKEFASLADTLGPDNLARMTPRELNEVIIDRTNPGLLTALRKNQLPPQARAAVEEVLNQDLKFTAVTDFAKARGDLSRQLNEALGRNVRNIDELRQVLRLFDVSSRGSIGESFYQTALAGTGQQRKPQLPRGEFDPKAKGAEAKTSIYPDFLRTNARRTVDIKTGYEGGGIEVDQIVDYNNLISASQRPGSPIQKRLAGLGVRGGRLEGHDYLFITNGTSDSRQAAERAYSALEKRLRPQELNRFGIYYLGDDGNIYRYLGQGKTSVVGPQLPN
jgi:hypothetical protein